MYDDIIGKKETGFDLICCASCVYSAHARTSTDCPMDDKKCFYKGEIMEYKGWSRFNPTYKYSLWKPIKLLAYYVENRKDETEI